MNSFMTSGICAFAVLSKEAVIAKARSNIFVNMSIGYFPSSGKYLASYTVFSRGF